MQLTNITWLRFQSLPKLVRISLNFTKLKVVDCLLPSSVKSLSLKGNNPLKILIDGPCLKVLDLDRCYIQSLDVQSFKIPNSIIELNLRRTRLFHTPSNEKDLVDDLSRVQYFDSLTVSLPRNLLILDAINCNLSSTELLSWRLSSQCKTLKYLYLSGNKLTKLESFYFPILLVTLDLSRNNMALPNRDFFKGFGMLENLHIAHTLLDSCLILKNNIHFPESIVALDLAGNNLTSEMFLRLHISNYKHLKFVRMGYNPRCEDLVLHDAMKQSSVYICD